MALGNNYSMDFEDTGPAFSDEDINAYVQANIGNPQAIAQAAQQYGVSLDDLSRATGYDTGTINNYFSQANVTPYYQQPAPAPEPQVAYTPEPPQPIAPQTFTPPQPRDFDNVQDFGAYDYFNEPEVKEPPAPPQPQIITPPEPRPEPQYSSPMAPVAPQAITAPTVTPVTQPKSLVEQILGQGTTSKWTGEGFGSAEKNAEDMAKILSGIGITDISQFGKITKSGINTEVYPDGTGGFFDSKGNKVDPSLVTNQSYSMESGDVNYYTAPVGTEEVFGNKLTGQAVPNTYGERQTGDAFGGTYAGSGNTGYRVQFDEKGNPFFYTSAQSSSDAGQWMPIVQLALAATGAGGLLGNALLGTGAGAVATNALGNAIISGTLTGATGGDALKGALLGGIGGAIGGYLQGTPTTSTGGTTTATGGIDGANINFNDLAETNVIDALKERGLSNAQIGQWMENASATDLGWVAPSETIPGANIDFNELADNALIDSLKAQGLSNQQISQFIENTGAGTNVAPVTPSLDTVTVTGQAPVATTPVVPTYVDPNVLAAVTNQLNTNVRTNVPEVEIKGSKETKTTEDTTTPTVTSVVPTVEVVGDKIVTKDDNVPTVEVVDTKPVKPVTPEVPEVVITDTKPVKPVTPEVPEVVITDTKPVKPEIPTVEVVEPRTPVVEPPLPPVVPPVIVPPIVLPPPPPPPPVVTPPPVTPTVTNGLGLNPGLIETVPFYNTTNPAQSKYYWGEHGFQTGPAFDAASYNAVAAPETPWGSQGVAAPLSAEDYQAIVEGRYTPEQFTPATRVQAYNPALLQTPVGQVNVSSGANAVSGPVTPTTRYDMTSAEVQQVAGVLGQEKAQALALAMANGDYATINAIKSQYEYALQNQGGGF